MFLHGCDICFVCPIVSARLCHGRVIAEAPSEEKQQPKVKFDTPRKEKASTIMQKAGWKAWDRANHSLKKDIVILKDKITLGEEENTGLLWCLTEGSADCSKVLEMNSYYKADLEHVCGTAVALVLATNWILAKIFWQLAFWGKELSRDSKGKRAEMSKMFNISKNINCAACKQNIFSCTTLPLGPKRTRSSFLFFLSETEGLSITAKAAKTKQNRHVQHLNTHSSPMLVCCTVSKWPKTS